MEPKRPSDAVGVIGVISLSSNVRAESTDGRGSPECVDEPGDVRFSEDSEPVGDVSKVGQPDAMEG